MLFPLYLLNYRFLKYTIHLYKVAWPILRETLVILAIKILLNERKDRESSTFPNFYINL
jgi:hypothetical protein